MGKYLLSFVLFCLLASGARAQAGFIKAYIITDKGDTVRGEAKPNPKKEMEAYEKIYFKDANGVQKNYRPSKILGYGVNEDHFISLDNDGEPRFYKVLARGPINLYVIMFEAVNMNEVSMEPEYYLAKPDNKKLVVIKQAKFKKQASDWMKDNMEFLNAYPDDKKFDQEKAIEVINQYNTWKAAN
jgi:hypothetical protein